MVEENDNPTAEELRRRIQERLESMNAAENAAEEAKDTGTETPSPVEEEQKTEPVIEPEIASVTPKVEEKVLADKKPQTTVDSKPIDSKAVGSKKVETVKPDLKKEPIKKVSTSGKPPKENEDRKGNGFVFLLVGLLVVAIGLFTWQYLKSSELETEGQKQKTEISNLTTEKESIQSELQTLLKDYKKMESSNVELNAQLEAERQKIEEYIVQVKKLTGKAQQYDFYKRKLKELEDNKSKFIEQIEQLTAQNQVLSTENQNLSTDLEKKQGENEFLAGKVALAQQIKGVNMHSEALTSKGKPTTKAKKVTEMKICITLVENAVAPAGKRDVFIRIVEPNGNIMVSSKDNLFEVNGNEIAYTSSGQINYANAEITACISYPVEEKSLSVGNYDLEVYVDGSLIGSRNIVLD